MRWHGKITKNKLRRDALQSHPKSARQYQARQRLLFANTGRRGDIYLGQIAANHVNTGKNNATFAQGRLIAQRSANRARPVRMLRVVRQHAHWPRIALGRHAIERTHRFARPKSPACHRRAHLSNKL